MPKSILITESAYRVLIAHAKKGYEAHNKREVGGHLLGSHIRNRFYVDKVELYKTPYAGRTHWSPNEINFNKKGKQLEKITGLEWIGVYHSHPEIAGKASAKQSYENRISHMNSPCPVEIIIRISAYAGNYPEGCIPAKGLSSKYQYVVCGYGKDRHGRIEKLRIRIGQ